MTEDVVMSSPSKGRDLAVKSTLVPFVDQILRGESEIAHETRVANIYSRALS